MKNTIIVLSIHFAVSTAFAQIDSLSVLFLGNSYTASNNLPRLFHDLANSAGKYAYVDANPPGGYWLEYHCEDSVSLSKINQGGWDYVVLQEQSQVPTIGYYRVNSMYPSAAYLDSIIHSVEGNTAFFMTWGREFGGQQIINGYASYPFIDFFQMQDTLAWAYSEISEQLSATLCPVGLAWEQAVLQNPTIDLWTEDGSHPTLLGSYLSACVFFGALFEESPVGLPYTAGIDSATALFLQNSAFLTLEVKIPLANPPLTTYDLLKCYPNPFNSSAIITFTLSKSGKINLEIHNIWGQRIANLLSGHFPAGEYTIEFKGEELCSGVYIVRLNAGSISKVENLIYIK